MRQTPPEPSDPATYSPRFMAAVARLLREEGGYVNHPSDPGGATNFGVSLRFLKAEGRIDLNHDGRADFDLDMDGDIDRFDIRRLTTSHACALYHRCFWQVLHCETLPAPLGEMLFDQAVNGGLVAAGRLLQQAVNLCLVPGVRIVADGQLGPKSRAAIAAVIRYPGQGMPALVVGFREAAKARYRALARANPGLRVFLKGWLARADRLGRIR